ncbi:MAG TPA: integrase arm-type DNA-binding domain-containing protein [Acetobacteraceae bacterium]|nr:integrase arm-type DNA-binding domain-containing protein [Acetobacteraceae bacterium]
MAREAEIKVRQWLKQPGKHGCGSNLWLRVPKPGDGNWSVHFRLAGKDREMGLGSFPGVSYAQACRKADAALALVADGVNPIEARKAERQAAAAQAEDRSFKRVAIDFITAHRGEWRNEKHAAQWQRTLETYAFPTIGHKPVGAVTTDDALAVLRPLWESGKLETGTRVRGRCEIVWSAAKVRGWCSAENPFLWRGHLQLLLSSPAKGRRVQHHAAMPYGELPTFMTMLAAADGAAALALRFAILTAARSGEVRGATWREIDLDRATWIVPAQRMKGGREHRVPLSAAALDVLRQAASRGTPDPDGLLFRSPAGGALSDMALMMLLRRKGRGDLTAHGFRSSFRDWAGETTAYPADVAEAALAHVRGDKTEAAYARGTLFEKRKALMGDWGAFCTTRRGRAAAEEAEPESAERVGLAP